MTETQPAILLWVVTAVLCIASILLIVIAAEDGHGTPFEPLLSDPNLSDEDLVAILVASTHI